MTVTLVPVTRRRNLDAVVTELAGGSCSVVHARMLRQAGICRKAVQERVADGRMVLELPRTYFVGPQAHRPTFEMRCMAGTLCAGPDAVATGETAATLWGAWDRGDGTVHIASSTNAYRDSRPPYVFHRSSGIWMPDGIQRVGTIPVPGVPETCLEAARRCTPLQVTFMIHRFVYLRMVTIEELAAFALDMRGMPGVATLRTAIELAQAGSAGSRSRSEDRLHSGLEAIGLPPDLVNVRGCMGIVGDEPDMVWMRERVNVECDGGHHDEPVQRERDRERDSEATARDWHVVRVRPDDIWRDLEGVLRMIGVVLAEARAGR